MSRRRWFVLSIVLAASGCESLFTEPAVDGLAVQVSLTGPSAASANYGDLSPALRDVRYVHFRFVRADGTRDTIVAGSLESGAFRARVTLRPQEARDWLEIQAELRMSNELPLFRGHALVLPSEFSPAASIELTPVAYSIGAPVPAPTITALGDTARLGGEARFANDMRIEGATILWESSNPSIAEVVDGDEIVPRTNGTVVMIGSSLGATIQRAVTVRQTPVALTGVGPADTTVTVGATFRARPFGEDRNGYPLLPGALVQWWGRGAVTVDANGEVRATASGTGFVDVSFGPTTHTAQVVVVP
ncbi:MAG: hypothetical protein WEB90_05295 [Gemmatimonadota bacterium]